MITELLEQYSKLSSKSLESFVWSQGLFMGSGSYFNESQYPEAKRTPKQCFHNATLLTYRNSNLVYAEGFFCSERLPIPLVHGWCLDTETGEVVDPTINNPEECEYYGLFLDKNTHRKVMFRTEAYGVLLEMYRLDQKLINEITRNHEQIKQSYTRVSILFTVDGHPNATEGSKRPSVKG